MSELKMISRQDGKFKLPFNQADIAGISVSDVDLVVVLKNGEREVLLGGALDAMTENPPSVLFADGSTLATSKLLNLVSEFGTSAVASPLAVGGVSPVPAETPKDAPQEHQASSQTAQEAEQADSTPPAVAITQTSPADATSEALKSVSSQPHRPEIAQPFYESHPQQLILPPERAASTPVPVHSVGAAEVRGISLFNVVGVRQDGATLYGAGGDPATALNGSLEAQSAAEHLVGTSGNDVIYGDDAQRMGVGFAKAMQITVSNSASVNSYSVAGLPSGFSFEGGSVDANGVWHLSVPASRTGSSFDGTYEISSKLLYPNTLATDSTGFAQSFVITIDVSVTDLSHQTVNFKKTATVIIKDVNTSSDLLVGSLGTDFTLILPAHGLSNVIDAGAGNDILYGSAANDTLDGGTGADLMVGGRGNDTYVVDDAGDSIVEAVGEGTDTVLASVSHILSANVENLTFNSSTAGLVGTGNALANVMTANDAGSILHAMVGSDTLIGGAGDDTLDGGSGADAMAGGAGNDTYVVDDIGDKVTELPGAGTDLVLSSISYTLSDNVENLKLVGTTAKLSGGGNSLANVLTANDAGSSLYGMAGDDTLIGGAGNDILDGGSGADAMSAGAGNDTYIVDDAGDNVIEAQNAGNDTVISSINYVLAAGNNVENLTLGGTADLNGTGNELDNVLTGNSGANVLLGGVGRDTLIGGAGDDTLDGGSGVDDMIGGTGDDTYVVDDSGDIISEQAGEGTDNVLSSVSYALSANIEDLTLTGTANIDGTGNDQANLIQGNDGDNRLSGGQGNDTLLGGAGNDTLDGGLGADIMSGGAGDDIYYVDDTGDVVTESAGEGTDLVYSTINYTLAANVEKLTLFGSANLDGTGNAQDNIITGNSGRNHLEGLAGADTLIGGAGDDVLDGGTGADVMMGGTANDTYIVDDAGDVVIEASNEGTDLVLASVGYTLSSNVENLTLTGSTAGLTAIGNTLDNVLTASSAGSTLMGMAGNDTLVGDAGNDVLNGGTGADTMIGGRGDDVYSVDDVGDVISEAPGAGTDLVVSSIDYVLGLGSNLENLALAAGSSNLNGTGNELANVLRGNDGANLLSGGAGNDTLIGGAGSDTLDGGSGADALIGGLGDDTYVVDDVNDVVTEVAGEGTDQVLASVSYTLAQNVENLALTGTVAGLVGTGNALGNILTTNTAGSTLHGMAGNDTLIGGVGNDTLDGGTGTDSMTGGDGNDTYIVDNASDIVLEAANEGTDLVLASVSYTLSSDVEDLTLTGFAAGLTATGNSAANVLTANSAGSTLAGMAGNDTLLGGAGNDFLDGGTGADTMTGGQGDDTYWVDLVGDVVTEAAGEGTDLVISSIDYALGLGSNLENLTLATGSANLNGTGNELTNVITGNDGDNMLRGGAGNDTLIGGAGNDTLDGGTGADALIGGRGDDTYIVDDANDFVTELAIEGTDQVLASISYTLTHNVENLTFTGAVAGLVGTGNALDNVLTANTAGSTLQGMAGNDTLIGGLGNDILDGGVGADSMTGSAGNDTYIVDDAGDVVIEAANEGTDLVLASVSQTLSSNVENLTLTGSAAGLTGTGNGLDNVLTANGAGSTLLGLAGNDILNGGAGNDTLDGGIGADVMFGGGGDDTFVVDNAGDVIVELAGEGTDTVLSSIDYTLAVGGSLENLTLTGIANLDGTGNELSNVITGNDGANNLSGGAGDDTIIGGAGNDTLDGGTGVDTMSGGLGDDTYIVDNSSDIVIEAAGEGTDLVLVSASYTLSSNV